MINTADPKKLESLLQEMSISIFAFHQNDLRESLDDFTITWYATLIHKQLMSIYNYFFPNKEILETNRMNNDKKYKVFLHLMSHPDGYDFGFNNIGKDKEKN